jgi:hypothetical protein
MANAFGVEEEGIDQVPVRLASHFESLTTMEEERYREVLVAAALLESEELGDEGFQGLSGCFFADEVETLIVLPIRFAMQGQVYQIK